MFYGWGRKNTQKMMTDGRAVVLSWRYVSLMFVFQVAFSKTWMLIGNDRSQDRELSKEELVSHYGDAVPELNLWQQWGLLISIGILVVLAVLIGALS